MNIRRAEEKDIPRIIELLKQVLQIHADIRPDIFISGTTKYTTDELAKMINDDKIRFMLPQTAVTSVWAMPFVSYRNSLFLTIQYRSSHCISTICA